MTTENEENVEVSTTEVEPIKRTTAKRKSTAKKIELGVYKMHTDSHDPVWGTSGSACFDLKAYLPVGEMVMVYNKSNKQRVVRSKLIVSQNRECIVLDPHDRALIPTGLIFDIPEGYDIRVHPRSGLSWKEGLTLSNAEGIIDYDYVEQLYISINNSSESRVIIGNGDRIAQAELTKGLPASDINIKDVKTKPKQKTNRSGGFGHTGK